LETAAGTMAGAFEEKPDKNQTNALA